MRASSLVGLCFIACNGDSPADTDIEVGERPTLVCPGDASCAPSEDLTLYAGASVHSIEPDCYESWQDNNGNLTFERAADSFLDCGCDRLCPDDPGYTGADEGESDGRFQAVYMAGGSMNRPIMGLRGPEQGGLRALGDGLYASVVVLRQGETTVAIASLDSIGLQYDDTLATRAVLAERGIDVDHLLIHSTHTHMAVDAIGLWGPSLTTSGYDPRYIEQVRESVVQAVEEAVAALEPVSVTVGEVDASSYSVDKGITNVVTDTRDPFIIDPTLGAARLVGAGGATVATLVSFGVHPETMLGRTAHASSDFVHALRATVSDGVVWSTREREGVGGATIFLNSAVGGMMTTLRLTNTDPDGNEWGSEGSWEKADAIGQQLGEMALDALEGGQALDEPRLSVRAQQFFLPVDNTGFQTLGLLGVLKRGLFNYDSDRPIDEDNLPDAQTEINLLTIGPLQLLAIPGELLPELAVGGYDGSFINAPGRAIIEQTENPPNLSAAPEGPYLKDDMEGSFRWIVGLANDEIGYIIPQYNFIVNEDAPYILEAPGDHYEETRSLGPTTAERIQAEVQRLITWSPG